MVKVEEKQQLNERLRQLYALNKSLDESDIKRKEADLYEEATRLHSSWKRALQVNGIKKRNLRERERFYYYHLMKQRYEKFGEEVLRPKNIEDEIKEPIIDVYKTIKSLKNMIVGWTEEKVVYEVRKHVLSGGTVEGLKKEDPDLYKQLCEYYDNLNNFNEDYEFRFKLPEFTDEKDEGDVIKEVEKPIEKVINRPRRQKKKIKMDTEDAVKEAQKTLKEIGYYENESVAKAIKQLIEGTYATKQDILDYLLSEMARFREKGERLTEEKIKENNEIMYHGMKEQFGSLRKAFEEVTKMMIG